MKDMMKRPLLCVWVILVIAGICSSEQLAAKRYVTVGDSNEYDFQDIQKAIDSLGADGGKVLIMPGRYRIKKTIKIPSFVTLQGSGFSTVVEPSEEIGSQPPYWNRVISNVQSPEGDSDIIICDLTVDGKNRGIYHKTGIYGISLEGANNSIIERVHVKNMSGEGIIVAYGKGQNVIRNNIVTNANHGINPHFCTGGLLIEGNRIERCKSIGIFAEGLSNIVIQNNICSNNAWWGIVWMGSLSDWIPKTSCAAINGNICSNNGYAGIFLNGVYGDAGSITVNDNICKNNWREGILAYMVHDISLRGNVLEDNDCGDLGLPYLRVARCENGIIYGNLCISSNSNTPVTGLGVIEKNCRQPNPAHVDLEKYRRPGALCTSFDCVSILSEANILRSGKKCIQGSLQQANLNFDIDNNEAEAVNKYPSLMDGVETLTKWSINESFGKSETSIALDPCLPYYGKFSIKISFHKHEHNDLPAGIATYRFNMPRNLADYSCFGFALRADVSKGQLEILMSDDSNKAFKLPKIIKFEQISNSWAKVVIPFGMDRSVSEVFDLTKVNQIAFQLTVPVGTKGNLWIDALGLGHDYSLPKTLSDNSPVN